MGSPSEEGYSISEGAEATVAMGLTPMDHEQYQVETCEQSQRLNSANCWDAPSRRNRSPTVYAWPFIWYSRFPLNRKTERPECETREGGCLNDRGRRQGRVENRGRPPGL